MTVSGLAPLHRFAVPLPIAFGDREETGRRIHRASIKSSRSAQTLSAVGQRPAPRPLAV